MCEEVQPPKARFWEYCCDWSCFAKGVHVEGILYGTIGGGGVP